MIPNNFDELRPCPKPSKKYFVRSSGFTEYVPEVFSSLIERIGMKNNNIERDLEALIESDRLTGKSESRNNDLCNDDIPATIKRPRFEEVSDLIREHDFNQQVDGGTDY